jgi:hypothetical protein
MSGEHPYRDITVEVGTIEVKSVNFPVIVGCGGKYESETGEAGNRGKCIEVVHTKLLHEPLCNKAHFVLLNGSVGLPLDAKDPLAANNVLAGGSRDCGPCVSIDEGGNLAVNCLLPFRPVRARACLVESFRVILSFSDSSVKDVLTICKESKIRRGRVGGEHANVIVMGIIGMHPTACFLAGWFIKFLARSPFSALNGSLFG